MNLKKLNEDITKLLHEAEGEEVTFADVFGEDLTGQVYDGSIYLQYKGMTSLKGAPKEVTGWFNCDYNHLTSLEYAPEKVGDYFSFHCNNITSLKGAPKEIGKDFSCGWNELTSLEFAPENVGGYFECSHNKLTSLQFAPKKVDDWFDCSRNNLTSLEGGPENVGGYFACDDNNLTSLEGFPKEIGRDFYCEHNPNLTAEDFKPIINRVKGKIETDIKIPGVNDQTKKQKGITLAVVDDGTYEQHLIAKKEGKVWVVEDDLNDAYSGETFTTLPKLYRAVAQEVADGAQGVEDEYLNVWLGKHDGKFYNYLLKAMKKNGYDPDDESNADDIW